MVINVPVSDGPGEQQRRPSLRAAQAAASEPQRYENAQRIFLRRTQAI